MTKTLLTIDDIQLDSAACFTGHRPDKLYGYDPNAEGNVRIRKALRDKIIYAIEVLHVEYFITGMAQGIDTWAARIVVKLKEKYPHIKLVAAIPCADQWKVWTDPNARLIWKQIRDASDIVHYVSRESFTKWCMNDRNIWMIEHAAHVIAVFDGHPKGGTYNCITDAKKYNRNIMYIDPHNTGIV